MSTHPKEEPDETQTRKALEELGDTGEQVAETLLQHDCRGIRGSAHSCPVARYLTQQFPGKEFRVTSITVQPKKEGHWGALTPRPVRQFIRLFDKGRHPKLETPEPLKKTEEEQEGG